MPHAGEVRGKYVPHNTNKPPPEKQVSVVEEDSFLNETSSPLQKQAFELEPKSITKPTKKKTWIIIAVIVVCLLIAIGIAVALALTLSKTDTSTTISSSTISFGNTTTTTTVTTTTTTTAVRNPCSAGDLRWSQTGITVLNSSQLTNINGIYIDSNDTLYVADETSNTAVWKLPLNATTATLVSGSQGSYSSASNRFYYPQDVSTDSLGNVYVSDFYNYRVQKFASGSSIGTTIAGITGSGSSSTNQFNSVRHIYVEPTGTYIYITDYYNNRVMRYSTSSSSGTSGVLVAGGNGAGYSNTTLYYPYGIHSMPSASSDLFISNVISHTIIRWTPGASSGYYVAGIPGTSGQSPVLLSSPTGVRVDSYLNFYVADTGNHRIQLFCQNSQTGYTIAGTGVAGNSATQLNGARSITFDSAMNLYVADSNNYRIQKFLRL